MLPKLEDGVTHASKLYFKIYRDMTYFQSRDDTNFIRAHGKRKAFHKGSNLSCRLHIHQHYDLYKEKCLNADIPVNHWSIPRPIWKEMEEEKDVKKRGRLTKKQAQQILAFEGVTGPHEFT